MTSSAPTDERTQELAGALHEVSNALTVVLGWLDVVRDKLPAGPDREALDVARTHARLGYSVARQAIGADVPESSSGQSSAYSVARSAITGVTPEAQRRGVSLALPSEADAHARVGNVGAVLQILTNVLLNAVAFTPRGRSVTMEIRDEDSHVVFTIRDEGPGIAPERVSSLFNGPVSTRRGGAGIGLRHSHALAAAHGGRLDVVGSGPGACFELSWPTVEARSAAHPHQRFSTASLSGTRVLVVEDDAAVRSLIELALEPHGLTTMLVGTATEFDLALIRGEFDVALVDLSPLGQNAPEALGRLRARCPSINIVLISGVASGVPAGVEHLIDAWVRKPFEMGEVLSTMARLMAARNGLQSATG
ncbi:MAG TPA: hybrid sensor histidine kinase/response regulator [Polyangiaceae bacterium]|nr:hybrid sensor histidine kinase/response regulator [Polyangiaceae bacterium]